MPAHLPLFMITTWLLAMLPGPGQALMIRQTLTGGVGVARATIAGTATGLFIWSTAAGAGLSAVLLAQPRAMAAARLAGGLLLCGLGLATLLARPAAAQSAPGAGAARPAGRWRGYLAGLGTSLGNPKAGVFAVPVLPQFAARGAMLGASLTLGAVWALVTGAWYLLFPWAAGRSRKLLQRPSAHRALAVVTGAVLLVLGAAVAAGA